VDHRDDPALPLRLQRRERPRPPGRQRPSLQRGDEEKRDEEERDDRSEVHSWRTLSREVGGYTQPVDGLFDWYWLGVVLGLGVSDGAMGREARRPLLAALFLGILALGVVLALVVIAWWAILAFAGAALVAWYALRRLSPAARPVAALATAALAFVPVLGYALVAVVPVAGGRLSRRADTRYAGLRVLAKD
jgi:hypothetical protein